MNTNSRRTHLSCQRPLEALTNGINAADQLPESANERGDTHRSKSSHELVLLALAQTAQPLTDGECSPGVVINTSGPQRSSNEARKPTWKPTEILVSMFFVDCVTDWTSADLILSTRQPIRTELVLRAFYEKEILAMYAFDLAHVRVAIPFA